ncbi:MAG: hypothetical protein JSU07_06080 [Bacteroidetes bacterium]|nr:hypothetical protein [Bacteroidota bacterium]
MKKTKFLLFPFAAALFITSCGGNDKAEDAVGTDTSSVAQPKVETSVSETFFQVPSPGEMLTFIKMVGGAKNKNIGFLNAPSNEKNYVDGKSKALNFGIYSTDLSYCSIFEIGSEAIKYFATVKKMGDEIGVSSAVKPEILKRLQSNVGNPDSLAVITDDVYFSSFQSLEDSKQGPTLALVVAGGWIESMFIATNLAKYEANSQVIERLADQKYTLENMLEFLKKHQADANVATVKTDFEALLGEFSKISEKDAEASKTKAEGKSKLLSGGKQLVISEENYKAIVEKVKNIRNSYTLTK